MTGTTMVRDAETFAIGESRILTYGSDRICRICGHALSIYNKTDVCFSHTEDEKTEGNPEPAKSGPKRKPSKRGTCGNCNRQDLQMVGSTDLCNPCYKAAKGLSGEVREKALAQIKATIQSGGLKRWGKNRKTMEVEIMANIIGTCKNCERPGMKIESTERGFCCTCRQTAAKYPAEPEEQKAALAATKIRMQKKGVQPHKPRAVRKPLQPRKGECSVVSDPQLLKETEFTIKIETERDRVIYSEIARTAETEFRSLSHQTLYFIKRGMEAENGA